MTSVAGYAMFGSISGSSIATAAVKAVFEKVSNTWGQLDVIFNTVGSNDKTASIDGIPYEEWKAVSDINISGSFLVAQAAFSMMLRQSLHGDRNINNGSISAHVPRPGSTLYAMSKHAVTGLTKSISLDGRKYGIACGQIDIGNAMTDMSRSQISDLLQADGSIRQEAVMNAQYIATSVYHTASLPLDANVQFMIVIAMQMPYIGRGYDQSHLIATTEYRYEGP